MIWIVLSGFAFGSLGIFVKKIYESEVSPHIVLTLRFVLASMIFGILLKLQKLHIRKLKNSKKTHFHSQNSLQIDSIQAALLLGAIGYAGFASCFMMALQTLNASTTILLLYTYPLFVWIGERYVFREKQNANSWVMLPLCMVGVYLVSGHSFSASQSENLNFAGITYGLMSGAIYAAYILVSRKFIKSEKNASGFSYYVHLGATTVLLGSGLLFYGGPNLLEMLWQGFQAAPTSILGLAILPTVIAISLFLKGLKSTTSFQASMGSITEPASAVLLSFWFLGEKLDALQVLGAVFVFMALYIHSKFSR